MASLTLPHISINSFHALCTCASRDGKGWLSRYLPRHLQSANFQNEASGTESSDMTWCGAWGGLGDDCDDALSICCESNLRKCSKIRLFDYKRWLSLYGLRGFARRTFLFKHCTSLYRNRCFGFWGLGPAKTFALQFTIYTSFRSWLTQHDMLCFQVRPANFWLAAIAPCATC